MEIEVNYSFHQFYEKIGFLWRIKLVFLRFDNFKMIFFSITCSHLTSHNNLGSGALVDLQNYKYCVVLAA